MSLSMGREYCVVMRSVAFVCVSVCPVRAAAEVTTLRRYRNVHIIIIIVYTSESLDP